MFSMRNSIIALGLAFIIAAAVVAWRSAHPPLTDQQALLRDLNEASRAIEDRSSARVERYLAHDFSVNGTDRSDFNNMMVGAFWQWRDVHVDLSNEQARLDGDTATTTGHYSVSYRPNADAPLETHEGDFTLQWRREDGDWKVVSAQGVNIGQQ